MKLESNTESVFSNLRASFDVFKILSVLLIMVALSPILFLCGWFDKPADKVSINRDSLNTIPSIKTISQKSRVQKASQFELGIKSELLEKLNVKTSDSCINQTDSMCSYKLIKPRSTQEFMPDKLVSVIPMPDENFKNKK